MSENDKNYQNLMKYLRQLKRDGALFLEWMPKYEKDGYGDPNGFITITISAREKNDKYPFDE